MNEATIRTELFGAICHNEVDTVHKLLVEGADVNRRFRNRLTPLMVAARAGAHAVIPVLLSHGAKVHEIDSQGSTAFHYLCRYGQGSHYHREAHTESARALLAAGADAYRNDAAGDSPFWLACRRGLVNVLKLIHAHSAIPINARDANGDTPLHLAVRSSYYTTHFLLNIGCDPEARGADGKSVHEIENLNYEVAQRQTRAGFSEEQWYKWYIAPPEPLAEQTDLYAEWARTADLQATDRRGFTALHHAAAQGRYDVAAILIERGAVVDAPARSGATPLMVAARAGRWKVGHLLMAHGADPYRRDTRKFNAVDYVRRAGNRRMFPEE